MIDHQENGYVAKYCDSGDFAEGIIWTLDQMRHTALREQARKKAVAIYEETAVAQRYLDVYRMTLKEKV